MRLAGKAILVLGGGGRLGRAIVQSAVAEGASLIIGESDQTAGEKSMRLAKERFPAAQVYQVKVDITDSRSLDEAFDTVLKKHDRMDAVVNTTYPRGARYGRKFEDVEYADFCENVNLHLGGYFLASQRAALFFRQQGHGNIVNIASIYGVIPPRFDVYDGTSMTMPVEYAAIKAAIIHLTKYMAQYCKPWNVRVNAVSPGGIMANQDGSFLQKYRSHCAKKGMLDSEDTVGTVNFLLSDDSQYITGQNLVVDDGYSL